jgi:cephalosporin hydroxylase
LKPSLVIEFGTRDGGSALFFASAMRQISEPFKALSWTSTTDLLTQQRDPDILFVESRSTVAAIC